MSSARLRILFIMAFLHRKHYFITIWNIMCSWSGCNPIYFVVGLTYKSSEDERPVLVSVKKPWADSIWAESRASFTSMCGLRLQCLLSRLKASLPAEHNAGSQFLSEYTENGFHGEMLWFGSGKNNFATNCCQHNRLRPSRQWCFMFLKSLAVRTEYVSVEFVFKKRPCISLICTGCL